MNGVLRSADRGEAFSHIARRWCSRVLLSINLLVCLLVFVLFTFHPAAFSGEWNGSTVATMALTAATIAMAAVTLMVGIIAVWGYATLREQSENIARETAQEAADRAVARMLGQLMNQANPAQQGPTPDMTSGYERRS